MIQVTNERLLPPICRVTLLAVLAWCNKHGAEAKRVVRHHRKDTYSSVAMPDVAAECWPALCERVAKGRGA